MRFILRMNLMHLYFLFQNCNKTSAMSITSISNIDGTSRGIIVMIAVEPVDALWTSDTHTAVDMVLW